MNRRIKIISIALFVLFRNLNEFTEQYIQWNGIRTFIKMCVTNNVCKFRLSKVSSKKYFFSKNYFMPKFCLLLAILSVENYVMLFRSYRAKFVAALTNNRFLLRWDFSSVPSNRCKTRWFLSRCFEILLISKSFESRISKIDLFQNNVFEILSDFCQKFKSRLWWIFFIYETDFVFTSERGQNEKFVLRNFSFKCLKFFIIYFLHQTVFYVQSSRKEFSLSFCSFAASCTRCCCCWCTFIFVTLQSFTSLYIFLYIHKRSPSIQCPSSPNFKFVVIRKAETKVFLSSDL